MKRIFPALLLVLAGFLGIQTETLAQRGWVRSTVYGNAGRHSNVALDENGNPIIAFHHRDFTPGSIGTVGYVKKIGGSFSDPVWSEFFEILDTSDPGERIGLAVRLGNPFLLFRGDWVEIEDILGLSLPGRRDPSAGLFFSESVGTSWFDLDFGRGGYQAIFKAGSEGVRPGFDTGYPLVCFEEDDDPTNDEEIWEGQLVHFWNDPARGRRCLRVGGLSQIAGPLALSVDHEGIAHIIAAYDFNDEDDPSRQPGALYYRSTVRMAGIYSWEERDGAVTSKPFYLTGSSFDPSQMLLSMDTDDDPDPNKRAHICAYLPDQKRLVYLHYDGAIDELVMENVDEPTGFISNVGKYCDIAVDRARNILHISYFDGRNKRLKYATKPIGGNSWTIANVDTGETGNDVGQYSSIAVDNEGFVHISYYNSTTDALKYATNRPGCGNEILEEGEACDDGNRTDRDGCSAACLTEGNLNADLSVTINAVPQTMLDNEAVAYTVDVANNGPEIAPSAFLNVTLAPGDVIQPPMGCTLIGSPPETMRCGPSPLTPGRSATLRFSSPSRKAGTRAVMAEIGSNGILDPNGNNNRASVNLTINPSVSDDGGQMDDGGEGEPPVVVGAGQGDAGGGEGGGGGEVMGGGCSLILPKK